MGAAHSVRRADNEEGAEMAGSRSSLKGVGAGHPSSSSAPAASLHGPERVMLWEVNIARGFLDGFSRMLSAHAIVLSLLLTVNLIGFLQPPRGWDPNTGLIFDASPAIRTFCLFNTLSLYTTISGLLFYIYCSHATVVALAAIPLPDRFDHVSTPLLHHLRSALLLVALPSVRRRCIILFVLLACSLMWCVAGYISAGMAALPAEAQWMAVIGPSIPGCALLLFFLLSAFFKLRLELEFKSRFKVLWYTFGYEQPAPIVEPLAAAMEEALDPLPAALSCLVRAIFRTRT